MTDPATRVGSIGGRVLVSPASLLLVHLGLLAVLTLLGRGLLLVLILQIDLVHLGNHLRDVRSSSHVVLPHFFSS